MLTHAGNALVVYHGTRSRSSFDKFDMSYFGQTDEGFYGRGFYFTPDESEASEYGRVLACHLRMDNPFYLRTYSSLGSSIELDLRDDLAKLKGMPSDLKTVRHLPDGYYVDRKESEWNGDVTVEYTVYPDKKFYGTEKEIYGPAIKLLKRFEHTADGNGELMAIVAFNDMVNEIDYSEGQANWLLQKLDRNNFHNILSDNGYDGLFVVGADGDKTPIDEVSEFMVWNTDQIEIIK